MFTQNFAVFFQLDFFLDCFAIFARHIDFAGLFIA